MAPLDVAEIVSVLLGAAAVCASIIASRPRAVPVTVTVERDPVSARATEVTAAVTPEHEIMRATGHVHRFRETSRQYVDTGLVITYQCRHAGCNETYQVEGKD